MFVKQYCLILLLSFICVALGDSNSSNDVTEKPEVKNVSEDVFQLGRTCVSDSDCHHLGTCEAGRGGKFCKCKVGTSGDFCEKVNECVDNPVKCGTLDDVSCVFDVEKEVAVCKCDNETKTYVVDEERCMSPCGNSNDCVNGNCYHKIGKNKFCACVLGTSGDYCEIIDECHDKTVDCGVNNNVTCTIGRQGSAYCQCDDSKKGFDYDKKICKDCSECGGNDVSSGKCSYKDGIRICSCKRQYYSNERGKCVECNCGQHSRGCKLESGTKICQCSPRAANKDGYCQKCECGFWQLKCEFKDGKQVCTCFGGYTDVDGTCKKTCNATNQCENGGKCVQNECKCLKGTSGDMCNTIDDCNGRGKCRFVKCLYNVTSQEAYCQCEGSLVFDEYSKTCKECDCGPYAKNCAFVRGKKTCSCKDSYEVRLGKCALCSCTGKSKPGGCKFDDGGNVKCECLKGYAQVGRECKECDCGDHGKCQLTYYGLKSCTCDEGYIENYGTCKECNCGKNGACALSYFDTKVCTCSSGYKEYQGTCKGCNCGSNAVCEFDKYGNPQCTCDSGYGMKDGVCKPCYCDPGTSCSFEGSNYYRENKVCICPKLYANDGGVCRSCDCEVEGANCTYSFSFKHCQCPKGYTEEDKPYRIFSKYCKDIDECNSNSYTSPCPLSSTKCVNTPGSYECACKDGYEGPNSSEDIKRFGCKDINECIRNNHPCNDPDARCVNTEGSYRCECHRYFYKDNVEKRNICDTVRPWRTATIVVGIAATVIIIGLLIAVIRRCSSEDVY